MADAMDIEQPATTAAVFTKTPTKNPQRRTSKSQMNGDADAAHEAEMVDVADDVMNEAPSVMGAEVNGDESVDDEDDDDDDEGVLLQSDPDDSDADEDADGFSGLSDDDDEPEEDAMEAHDGGVRISPSLIPTTDDKTSTTSAQPTPTFLLNPQKPTPYVPDAGHLLISDPNPLPPLPSSSNPGARESVISAVARDAAQSLLNTLLTTCPITTTSSTSTSRNETASGSGVLMTLPAPQFHLPREKRIPERKEKTKWQRFAEKKGIKNKKREGRVFDEETKEWRPRYGMRAPGKKADGQWLVEVDEKKEESGDEGDKRKLGREERKEGMRRQARRERKNQARGGRKGG
ncbi:MAG: hypothetical protein Q9159_001278 [Coniocarpon cinnabarinum]